MQAAFRELPQATQERMKALLVLEQAESATCFLPPMVPTISIAVVLLTCAGCWLQRGSDPGVGIPFTPHPAITALDALLLAQFLLCGGLETCVAGMEHMWRAYDLLGELPAGAELGGVSVRRLRQVASRHVLADYEAPVVLQRQPRTQAELRAVVEQHVQRHRAGRRDSDLADPYLIWVSGCMLTSACWDVCEGACLRGRLLDDLPASHTLLSATRLSLINSSSTLLSPLPPVALLSAGGCGAAVCANRQR